MREAGRERVGGRYVGGRDGGDAELWYGREREREREKGRKGQRGRSEKAGRVWIFQLLFKRTQAGMHARTNSLSCALLCVCVFWGFTVQVSARECLRVCDYVHAWTRGNEIPDSNPPLLPPFQKQRFTQRPSRKGSRHSPRYRQGSWLVAKATSACSGKPSKWTLAGLGSALRQVCP